MKWVLCSLFMGLWFFSIAGCCGNPSTIEAAHFTCLATLMQFDEQHPWSDYDDVVGFDDGVAPLATFKITEPSAYRSHEVRILFKSTHLEKSLLVLKQSVGEEFSINLPADFLTGEANTIDDEYVNVLEKRSPSP